MRMRKTFEVNAHVRGRPGTEASIYDKTTNHGQLTPVSVIIMNIITPVVHMFSVKLYKHYVIAEHTLCM